MNFEKVLKGSVSRDFPWVSGNELASDKKKTLAWLESWIW